MSEEFTLSDAHTDPLYKRMIEAGFLTTDLVHWFDARVTLDDLKNALFNTNRMQTVPLTIEMGGGTSCVLRITLVRPIYQPSVSIEDHLDGEDVWPDWYIEGETLLSKGRFIGEKVRVYFSVGPNGIFWDGYIQALPQDAPSATA